MIVNRVSFVVREEHSIREALDIFKSYPPQLPQPTRVLRPSDFVYQDRATLIFEFEFDSLADMVEQWAKAHKDPDLGPHMERVWTVCERNSRQSNVWQVVQ